MSGESHARARESWFGLIWRFRLRGLMGGGLSILAIVMVGLGVEAGLKGAQARGAGKPGKQQRNEMLPAVERLAVKIPPVRLDAGLRCSAVNRFKKRSKVARSEAHARQPFCVSTTGRDQKKPDLTGMQPATHRLKTTFPGQPRAKARMTKSGDVIPVVSPSLQILELLRRNGLESRPFLVAGAQAFLGFGHVGPRDRQRVLVQAALHHCPKTMRYRHRLSLAMPLRHSLISPRLAGSGFAQSVGSPRQP